MAFSVAPKAFPIASVKRFLRSPDEKMASGKLSFPTQQQKLTLQAAGKNDKKFDGSTFGKYFRVDFGPLYKNGVGILESTPINKIIGIMVAGAIAKKILKSCWLTEIIAFVSKIGNIIIPDDLVDDSITQDEIDKSPVWCPDLETSDKMLAANFTLLGTGETEGGVITLHVRNAPDEFDLCGYPLVDYLKCELPGCIRLLPAATGVDFLTPGFFGEFSLLKPDDGVKEELPAGDEAKGFYGRSTIKMRIYFGPPSCIAEKMKN